MHDPSTLAFDVRIGKFRLAEIWHIDPETDGDDDSCGWAYPRLSDSEMALARSLIYDEHDNARSWFKGVPDSDAVYCICQMFRIYKAHARPWWRHPRWHIHHWRIKIVSVFKFKRWMFSRCVYCGGRFPWGYDPTCTVWSGGTGPLWFRSQKGVYHHECYSEFHHENA